MEMITNDTTLAKPIANNKQRKFKLYKLLIFKIKPEGKKLISFSRGYLQKAKKKKYYPRNRSRSFPYRLLSK